VSYLVCPTYEQPIAKAGSTHPSWYRFFQGIYKGAPPSAEMTLQVTASPFRYTAPSSGFVILKGGTVTGVEFTRANTTLTGQTQGVFPLSQADQLTVTYSGLPTMTWVPT
jgi:hypothetical protein